MVLGAFIILAPGSAQAQRYTTGQRLECDAMGLHKFYKPGVVMPFHPGETYNGYAAGSGYFYRVHIDGGADEGVLCRNEDIRPVQVALRQAAPVAAAPARGGAVAAEARFGTRSPRTCAAVKTRPTLDQMRALVQCQYENKTRDLIYLDEHLVIEAGGTRPYSQFNDGYSTGIDTTAPVIPIRGSVDAYQCAALSKYTNVGTVYDTDNTGRNCAVSPIRQSTGTCYRTTFGDWQCHLYQAADSSATRLNQPPPR